jgi:phage tail sheath gpL-like
MPSVQITLTTRKDPTNMVKPSGQAKEDVKRILNELNGIQAGKLAGKIDLSASATDAVAATGTITLASLANGNTVTIGKTVFTASSTPTSNTATAVDFESDGADDTADAASLAAAINANALGVAPIVYATSALGVVTLTCRVPGLLGNYIALAKSGAPITVSGTYLSGGTGGSGTLSATPITLSRV